LGPAVYGKGSGESTGLPYIIPANRLYD
jgi:hypothetical protein